MAETFANNATGVLNATITSGATSLVLNSGQGAAFPSSGNFRILIESEIILVGARSGDTLSSLTRGQEGTAAAGHNAGVSVTHILTASALGIFAQSPVLLGVQFFTSSGTYTPTAGTKCVYVECIGAGGGSGGTAATAAGQATAAGGGGGGAYAAKLLTSNFSGKSYTIGAAGAAGAAGNNAGGTGGDTLFDSTVVVAKGGGGGGGSPVTAVVAATGAIGPPGLASGCTGDVKIDGSSGGAGIVVVVASMNLSGRGGGSAQGFGGFIEGGIGGTAPGTAGRSYGGGAAGALSLASQAAQAGAAGATGVIRIWEFG